MKIGILPQRNPDDEGTYRLSREAIFGLECPKRYANDSRIVVPEEGIEPSQPQGPRDFESRASTNSATPAKRHVPERADSLPKTQCNRWERVAKGPFCFVCHKPLTRSVLA